MSDVGLEGLGRGAKQEDEAVIKQGKYINTLDAPPDYRRRKVR